MLVTRGDDVTTRVTNNKIGQINIVLDPHNSRGLTKNNHRYNGKNPFSKIETAFNSVIGMSQLKKRIKEIYATIVINQRRYESGLQSKKQVLHMLFKGNPGTGKTTVARKLAILFKEMNLLSKGHLIEVERADLVGEYIGQTAQKTRKLIQQALGGILFIDEAYALARGGEKDFGKEAIDTLVKQMEDYQHDFVLILAGYPNEMDHFLLQNPGLQSRFPFILNFPNYTAHELLGIAKQMIEDREYKLTKEAEWKLHMYLTDQLKKDKANFSNGRLVRNLIEDAIRNQALRLIYQANCSFDQLITIEAEDILFDKNRDTSL